MAVDSLDWLAVHSPDWLAGLAGLAGLAAVPCQWEWLAAAP